jgi:hypothetical protein
MQSCEVGAWYKTDSLRLILNNRPKLTPLMLRIPMEKAKNFGLRELLTQLYREKQLCVSTFTAVIGLGLVLGWIGGKGRIQI